MKVDEIKVCVLRIEGTNCEQEAYDAFKTLGAAPEKVHLKQLIGRSPAELRRDLDDFQVLMGSSHRFLAGDGEVPNRHPRMPGKDGLGTNIDDVQEGLHH